MTRLVMTWCVCTLTRKDMYMGDNLMMFINAIDGAIHAIKAYTDHAGEIFALSLLAEPRVSYTDIVNHAREYASLKWLDTKWMKLLEF
jgi:hypothetical protein